jgi:L-serine dehydratase
LVDKTYFSTGGGFIASQRQLETPLKDDLIQGVHSGPFAFGSGAELVALSTQHDTSIANIMTKNEDDHRSRAESLAALDAIGEAMLACITRGLAQGGTLPGGLNVRRRAHDIHQKLLYRFYSKTRNFSWVMTRKLSDTLSRKFFHSCGMVSRMNARMASANCF